MTCSGCAFDVSPDFTFCPRCGQRLPAPCTACGFPCAPAFAFCLRCGAARAVSLSASVASIGSGATPAAARPAAPDPPGHLPGEEGHPVAVRPPAAPASEADRRQVTVLFA